MKESKIYIKATLFIILLTSITAMPQTFDNSEMVLIKGGTFSMGESESDYEGPPGSYDALLHSVTISDFSMSKTEITNRQYVDFLNLAYSAGLLIVDFEIKPGPDRNKQLVYGSPNAPEEYRGFAIINLDGTRVMKDHDNSDGDSNPFTGVIEPENPLNIFYIGFDDNLADGEKFFLKDPAVDFDWNELTNYYNYSNTANQLDSSIVLNDFDSWAELADLPNNLPTLEEIKNWPATFIRWYGAKAFTMFYGIDLPTEAQWEYAATGGNQLKYATSDGAVNEDGTSANWNFLHEEPALHHVYDVMFNEPSPFGLYNMAGNVWEWCEDWYSADFYAEGQSDPVNNDSTSNKKVRRGGSWNYHKATLKAAARFEDEKFKGNDHFGFRVVDNDVTTSVGSSGESLPSNFTLEQNYPNPFNPSTVIKFNLPETQYVSLKIYDILGSEVKTLVSKTMEPGEYSFRWNGENNSGAKVSGGLFIYKITAGNFAKAMKMILLK